MLIMFIIISVFIMIKIGGKIKAIGNVIRPRGGSRLLLTDVWTRTSSFSSSSALPSTINISLPSISNSVWIIEFQPAFKELWFSCKGGLGVPALPALQVYVKARLEGKGDSTIATAYSWPIFEDEDFVLSERIDLKLAPLALGSPIDGIHLFCESIKSIKGFYVEQTQTRRPMATLPCFNR